MCKQPLVYIILLNYNGFDDTRECIRSLKSMEYKNYKIVVVDNKSTDGSLKKIKENIHGIAIIENNTNEGFSKGNNLGIEYALREEADYILLLNNDTVVEKSFLDDMISSIQNNNDIDVLGCKINYYSNKDESWFAGGKIDWNKYYPIHYKGDEITKIQEVDFLTGCCILLKKKVCEKILLPEEYFMYFEDVDYCIKIKELGYKIFYNPDITIYHKVSASSGGEESPFFVRYWNRNRIIFMNKYKYKVKKYRYYIILLKFYISRILKYFIYFSKCDKEKRLELINGVKQGIDITKDFFNR